MKTPSASALALLLCGLVWAAEASPVRRAALPSAGTLIRYNAERLALGLPLLECTPGRGDMRVRTPPLSLSLLYRLTLFVGVLTCDDA